MDGHGRLITISSSLVDALRGDPFYRTITADLPDEGTRREALRRYFEYSMLEGERLGCCSILPDDRGAAVWVKPCPEGRALEEKGRKHAFLASILGPQGLADYHRIIGFMSPRSERAVGGDAWYLSILGVSPAAQGTGLGGRLLGPTLAEADAEGAVCYLETYSPRSMRFYGRLGFEQVASHLEPVTSAEYWIMVRRPSARHAQD